MRGWSKPQRVAYQEVSEFVLTSANVLHIKILSDGNADHPPKP
jgi:hypothetical protein